MIKATQNTGAREIGIGGYIVAGPLSGHRHLVAAEAELFLEIRVVLRREVIFELSQTKLQPIFQPNRHALQELWLLLLFVVVPRRFPVRAACR